MRNIFRRAPSGKVVEYSKTPPITDDICECILSKLFYYILPSDNFYFVKNPSAKKDVLRVRSVCKQWDCILKKIIPIKKHLKIEQSCCNNSPTKGKILENNVTDSLFVNGFSNSLVLHLCVSHFTLDLSEKFGTKITHMYLQSVDGIAGFLPRIVRNTKHLETLVLSDCYWIGRLSLSSSTLTAFTLYKVVGLEILQLKCHNLGSLVYNECNLSPLLSCENNLKILVTCHTDIHIQISSLYIEQVEISCEKAKVASIDFNSCCGNKIHVRSPHLQQMSFRNTKYSKIMTTCPALKSFQIEGVKSLKRLALDSGVLARVNLGKCVVKSLTCGTLAPNAVATNEIPAFGTSPPPNSNTNALFGTSPTNALFGTSPTSSLFGTSPTNALFSTSPPNALLSTSPPNSKNTLANSNSNSPINSDYRQTSFTNNNNNNNLKLKNAITNSTSSSAPNLMNAGASSSSSSSSHAITKSKSNSSTNLLNLSINNNSKLKNAINANANTSNAIADAIADASASLNAGANANARLSHADCAQCALKIGT